jgi:outer membrane protein assembly factor BamB
MSVGIATGQVEIASPATATKRDTRQLRVWPAIVMLAAFWAFMYVNHNVEMSGAVRFISRMIAGAILLLAFTGWWLSRSTIRWSDRLLAMVAVLVIGASAKFVSDKTMTAFGYFLSAFPIVLTAWTAWLLVARSLEPFLQRAGFCAIMMLVCGYFTLIRFDGLEANQSAETSWRWNPSREQAFLASHVADVKRPAGKAPAESKPWTVHPGDSPEYRGVQRDGTITGVTLATDWNTHPPKELWRKKVGPSWSGMIVVDGHIVTQEQRENQEVVACYDAATGNEVWTHSDPVRFEESLSGAGPRGTPTFVDGRIYTYGAKGNLNCLKAETGEVVWTRDCFADAELTPADMPQWGYSASPLVVDGLVIVFAGGGANKSVLAYNADDGKLAWSRAGGKQSYSSPQLATLHGVKQIVMHDNRALMGLNIPDGAVLWELLGSSEMSLPMLQPHAVENNNLVVSTEPELAMVEIKRDGDIWSAAADWTNNKLRAGFNDFVVHNGCVFALDDGVLCCLDLTNGERLWKKGRLGHGQILLIPEQNLLLLLIEKGESILVSVDKSGYKELGRFKTLEGKTWNSPVLVGNRLYARNSEEMAAFEVICEKTPAGESAAAQK